MMANKRVLISINQFELWSHTHSNTENVLYLAYAK